MVTAVVSKGEPVSIPGFANSVKVNRAARMGRNPATGETIRIKASKKARITAVKAFKDAVLASGDRPQTEQGRLPHVRRGFSEGRAGKPAAPVAAKAPARKAPAAKKVARGGIGQEGRCAQGSRRTRRSRKAPAKKAASRSR